MHSFAVAPIPLDSGTGAISISVDDPRSFGERQLGLLAGIAAQAKLAIANAKSFDTLERTFLSTVETLANALEANDEYTSLHARSIRDMAHRGRRGARAHPVALKRVELAALFHDIGKIGVPTDILTKPGPLTPAERDIMERHPELGEKILAPSSSCVTCGRSCARVTSAGTATATPTASRARRSPSRHASSSPATRIMP